MSAQYMTPNNNHLIKHPLESKGKMHTYGILKKKKTDPSAREWFTEQHITRRIDMSTLLWQKVPNQLNPLIPVLPLRITTKK
jgi:hypothetical protein